MFFQANVTFGFVPFRRRQNLSAYLSNMWLLIVYFHQNVDVDDVELRVIKHS